MKDIKNNKNAQIVLGIMVLLIVFYGGVVYGKGHPNINMMGGRAQTFGQNGGGRMMRVGGNFGGFTTGEIISKDPSSITLKLADGGSRIIFLSPTTLVSKQAAGSAADLVAGATVSIMGMANADGSVNAQTVQIRPVMPVSAQTTPARQ